MAMKRVGNWAGAKAVINSLGAKMYAAQQLSLRRFGLKAEAIAKGHISAQDLNWKPLSPKTLAAKIRAGYSENILVQTSTYFQSITTWVAGETVYIGVKREARDKEGNVIANIARVHEYGSTSAGIPARPLWGPSLSEAVKWHLATNTPAEIFFRGK
ncbi:hypothetical protein UFOVP1492_121 [uncultured Caudovirales phage]|uniref:Uncharacterized protein n=1 Tax=uncultured Caudovirales phage TaxID=2100421 RepID=A0A6J7XIQ3_9CAUD|nr:hypothetical protein UFOVP1127_13 [uncultured Caudovirales phage]CAB4193332.1 hypothetical protein UFOVP1242_61 [uncultured Caudovirales phage]CAB4217897.1 hypothetical protein UFOVP1492_121 [uncultured Caudovirales phage]CAB5231045.1 hypothetical protein UFOVP1580_14 [uncultured Caudovirales phage]